MDDWITRIRQNYPYLIDEIEPKPVIDFLFSKKVLDLNEHSTILNRPAANEQIRELLRIMMTNKTQRHYELFRDVLLKNQPWIVDKLNETNMENVIPDVPDSTAMSLQSNIDRLRDQLTVQIGHVQISIPHSQNQNINIVMSNPSVDRGPLRSLSLTNDSVDYLSDLPANFRRVNPNEPYSNAYGGVDDAPGSRIMSNIEYVSRTIGKDIAMWVISNENSNPPANPYVDIIRAMRRRVKIIFEKYHNVFADCLQRLNLNENNGFDALRNVANEIFQAPQDRTVEINWGRIVTLFAFAAWMAKEVSKGDYNLAEHIGDYVGYYIATNLGGWIEDHGGWNAFNNLYAEIEPERTTNYVSALVTGVVSLGVLVMIASQRT